MTVPRASAAAAALLLLVAYANHFQNGFHFDDDHTIVHNVFVRSLSNVPRYFTDATTASVLPANRNYRPVLQTMLSIDYRLAGGYHPLVFQADSFAWFLLQLACMWWLFARVAARAGVDASFAWLPTAVYALHPACAETVNYIIQRGDVISTCGAVAALAMYAGSATLRRGQLYLIPVVVGSLAKPPALMFPALLFAYLAIVDRQPLVRAARACAPSVAVVGGLAIWMARQTPTFTTGGGPLGWYWLTQAFVALRYAFAFFAPVQLSADNDWPLLTRVADARAIAGLAFVAALAWAIAQTLRRDGMRPAAFGLVWFALALVPTSVVPLAEVANDHRMFFPFVGLSLAVCWAAAAWWRRQAPASPRRIAAAGLVAAILVAEAAGVRARNEVWRSDESLWYDVTVKSPTNGRGLMNYGLTRMAQGDYATAIAFFERALAFAPNYPLLHINLGIAYGGTGRAADAEREFHRAIALAPDDWRPHYYYGRWLREARRRREAVAELETAARQNPADVDAARELELARRPDEAARRLQN